MQKIDFTKLLGFDTIKTDEADFSDATFAAKLGAKVGDPESGACPTKGVGFQDEGFGAKLGAKISIEIS
jgi:hypothetical protein